MNLKRLAAVLLALLLTLSFASCGNSRKEVGPVDVSDYQRSDLKLEEMTFIDYDDTHFNDIVDALDEAILKEGNDEEVKRLIEELRVESSLLQDALLHLELEYYSDPSNNEKFKAYTDADNLSLYVDDDLLVIISRVLDSPYEQLMLDAIGIKDEEYIEAFYDYEGMTDEEAALQEQIKALQAEFNEWYAGTKQPEAVINGETWNWDRYYEENGGYDVYEALYKEEGLQMGRIQMELVSLRNQVAAIHGYDNYYDMAWTESYSRNYTYNDFQKVAGFTKENLSDILLTINRSYLNSDAQSVYDIDPTTLHEKLLASDKLMPNARQALEYIHDKGLMYVAPDGSYQVGFSTKFESFGEPFIYVTHEDPADNLSAIETITHETGHCINFFYDKSNVFGAMVFDLDVAETQSTGMVLMYMDVIKDLYDGAEESVPRWYLLDAALTLINCGYQAEVEHLMYTSPDLTPLEISQKAGQIAHDYGYYGAIQSDGNSYFWAHIPHYSDSPGYVVSYVMSQAASIGVWTKSMNNREKAMEMFDEILTLQNNETHYDKMVEEYDLGVYQASMYKNLKKEIMKLWK